MCYGLEIAPGGRNPLPPSRACQICFAGRYPTISLLIDNALFDLIGAVETIDKSAFIELVHKAWG